MSTSRIPNVAILGLLVTLCLLSALGFGIAEQIVDTDPHVVLEVGTRGILPCRTQRRGYSVEWKRQLSSGSELLVSLDLLFDVGARDGPGYEAGLFNITDDYSLVIKDVKVQDEGLYICSFSDYQTGITFRNSTRVSVQAFPDERFPTVQECIGNFAKSGLCTLPIHATSNLTCFVLGYYPHIDLFFLRGFEKVTPSAYEEWNNTDGTKNKNITVQISVSDEPYQCVASELPGIAGNRSVLVIVQAWSKGPNPAAIVAPVLIAVVVICLLLKLCLGNGRGWCCRLGYNLVPGEKPLKAPNMPKGRISKLELWELVTNAKENGALDKLCKALRRLLDNDTLAVKDELNAYEDLCTWKSKTSSLPNQRDTLYSICCKVGMADITNNIIDFVMDPSQKVTRLNIEHILWEIDDTRKLTELLKTIGLDDEEGDIESQMGREEVIDRARMKLLTWRNPFDINPLVTLSLKLDDLHCPTNFFKTPKGLISKLELWKLKAYTTEKKALKSLCEALRRLLNTDALTLQNDLFVCLCTWKSETSSNYDQRDTLYSACCEARMTDIVRKMIDFVMNTSHKVSRMNIEHILRESDDTMKITELLKALGLDHEALAKARLVKKRRKRVVIDMARMELLKWRDRDFDINPLVTLSLKLGDLHCQTNFYKFPEGRISKLELSELITSAKENGAFKKLSKVVRHLHRLLANTETLTLQTDVELYESLCIWKSQTSSNCNQREKLYSVCCEVGMTDIIKKMIDFTMDASHKVSRDDLEHILQEIVDTRKITELLKVLGLDHDEVAAAGEKEKREVMDTASEKLLKWQDQEFYIYPLVTLCMKLEDLHCEIEFFK